MKSIAKIILSSILPFASYAVESELGRRKLPISWHEDSYSVPIDGSACSERLAGERFMLGVLTDRGMAIGPYLGDHRTLLRAMEKKGRIGNVLWAGEIRTRHGEILEANETSGFLHSNGVRSDVAYVGVNPYMPMAEGATVHAFDPENKHLFPMFEKGISSNNFRHDFRNKVIPLGLIGMIALSKMGDFTVIEDPLEFLGMKFDFGVFDMIEAMLPVYFDHRTNAGIKPASEFKIIGREYAEQTIREMKGWLDGRFPLDRSHIQALSSDIGRIITFLSQEPKDGITVYVEEHRRTGDMADHVVSPEKAEEVLRDFEAGLAR